MRRVPTADVPVEKANLSHVISEVHKPNQIIGPSQAMPQLIKDIARVSQAPLSVLITGETGTGKELIARTIHVPPIRERPEDILPLAEYSIFQMNRELNKSVERIPKHTIDTLKTYSWPQCA